MAKKKKDDQMELIGPDGDQLIEELAKKIDSAVSTIRDLRKERDALRDELEAANERLGELEQSGERLDELEREAGRFEEQKGEIRNRIEALLEKFERLEEE